MKLSTALARGLTALEETVLAYGILIIAALTVTNVLARTFTGRSLAEAEELSQFALIGVTFVGLSYAAAQGRHIRMTAFYDLLTKPHRRRLRAAICIATACLLAYLAVYAVSYALTVRALGSVSPVLQVPLWIVYLWAPAGLSLACLQYTLTGWQNIHSKEEAYVAYGLVDSHVPPAEDI